MFYNITYKNGDSVAGIVARPCAKNQEFFISLAMDWGDFSVLMGVKTNCGLTNSPIS
jgi:hypothetical protein